MQGVTALKGRYLAAVVLLLSVTALLFPGQARAEEPLLAVSELYQESVYYQRLCNLTRSGDYRADLVNVALSQVGYHEGDRLEDYAGGNPVGKDNYIEYSSAYFGFNGQWCAMFVSWCARQAGIPKYMLNNAARAAADGAGGSTQYYFHIATRKPDAYAPIPGDLVFFSTTGYGSSHVGIVAAVTEDAIWTVEGNICNAVRVNRYPLDSPLLYRYGVYSYEPLQGEIAPIPSTELVFASDTGEDHGIQPDDEGSSYSFHSLYPVAGTALQIPTRSFCREGYLLQGYFARRCDDGRWLAADRRWVAAEEIQTGQAVPLLLAEGSSVAWTGAWTEAPQLELHCVWQDAAGLTAPDETAAALCPVDETGWQNPYYDLRQDAWYYADVRAASQAGLLPYTWSLDSWRDSTREEFVLMLYRLMGSPAAAPADFEDLEPDSEAAAAVAWAYALGIVHGLDATHFGPQQPITREQVVAILHRLCADMADSPPEPTDASADDPADLADVSPWAWDAVTWARERQILQGKPVDGQLYLLPQQSLTRPEGVALLRRTEALLPANPVDITEKAVKEKVDGAA